MTSQEIRGCKNSCDDGAWESANWLQEIAAQLAESNEHAATRNKLLFSLDDYSQENLKLARENNEILKSIKGRTDFVDQVMDETKKRSEEASGG